MDSVSPSPFLPFSPLKNDDFVDNGCVPVYLKQEMGKVGDSSR